jgi:polyisoprenoid-binding protein YceI
MIRALSAIAVVGVVLLLGEATAPPPFDPSAWDPAPIVQGQSQRLEVVPALSRIHFKGSSTLHDFEGGTQSIRGELKTDPGDVRRSASAFFRIDPASLDTDNDDRDERMHTETLDVKRHQEIVLTLEKILPAPPDAAAGDWRQQDLEAEGQLLLHGQTKAVRLPVRLEVQEGGRLRLSGRLQLDMTQWGMEPPSTAWVINVDKLVTVRWDLVLMRPRPKPAAPEAPEKK